MFSGEKTFLLLVLGVIAAGVAMLALNYLRRNRLRRVGVPAVAQVVDVKIERILRSDATDNDWVDAANRFKHERKYTYTFYYRAEGIAYTHELVQEGESQMYSQGASVNIFYNPENPKEMMTAIEVSAPASGLGSMVPMLAIVLALILFFLFRS